MDLKQFEEKLHKCSDDAWAEYKKLSAQAKITGLPAIRENILMGAHEALGRASAYADVALSIEDILIDAYDDDPAYKLNEDEPPEEEGFEDACGGNIGHNEFERYYWEE